MKILGPISCVALSAAFCGAACSSNSADYDYDCTEDLDGCPDPDPGSDPQTKSSWAVGSWYSPMYDADGAYQPPMAFGIHADGTWEHNTDGIIDASGTWSVSGDSISLGGSPIEQYLPNCTAFRWENDTIIWAEYYRDDMPEGCPNTPEPLNEAEKCLTGDFQVVHQTNVDTGTFKTKRTDYRTVIYEQTWSDTSTSVVGNWRWSGSQYCEIHTGEAQEICGTIDWNEVRSSRVGSEDPGCVYPDTTGPEPDPKEGCDDGTFGDLMAPDGSEAYETCDACITCSVYDSCAAEWDDYYSEDTSQAWGDCYALCTSSPCYDQCDALYPSAADAYFAAASCSVCEACPNNCNAAANCE